jgi:hypothetical protein
LPSFTLPATEEKSVDVTVVENQVSEVTIHLTARTTVGERLVYTVDDITLGAVDFPAAQTVLVTAKGTVRSSGWINPRLRQRMPVQDGILEFDFVATPSDGMVLPVISPVSATATAEQPALWRGVRVYAETNMKALLFP